MEAADQAAGAGMAVAEAADQAAATVMAAAGQVASEKDAAVAVAGAIVLMTVGITALTGHMVAAGKANAVAAITVLSMTGTEEWHRRRFQGLIRI